MICREIIYVHAPGLYLPWWLLWTAGLLPFAMAVAARIWHLEQVRWVAMTLIAEFLGIGFGIEVHLHRWLLVGLMGTSLALSGWAWAAPWIRRRLRLR